MHRYESASCGGYWRLDFQPDLADKLPARRALEATNPESFLVGHIGSEPDGH